MYMFCLSLSLSLSLSVSRAHSFSLSCNLSVGRVFWGLNLQREHLGRHDVVQMSQELLDSRLKELQAGGSWASLWEAGKHQLRLSEGFYR